MSDFLVAQIRTWVPAAVGAILTWLAAFGLDLFEVEAQFVTFLTAAIIGLYYLAVRALAERWPWFGNLLGVNAAPTYPAVEK